MVRVGDIIDRALIGLRWLRAAAARTARRGAAAYRSGRAPRDIPPSPAYSCEELEVIFVDTDPVLVQRFWEYHRNNRHVFREFRARAAEMKATGQKRYSGWVIINRIRWDFDLRTCGDPFKINNDYIALYARLLIHEVPAFDGFFELRQMKGSGRKMSQEERRRRNNLAFAFGDPSPGQTNET